MRANERIHAHDDQIIDLTRIGQHTYTVTLNKDPVLLSFVLGTDDVANLADALLVISEADRAERMAERKQQKGK